MANLNVGISDNGLVILTVTDEDTGEIMQIPMQAHHAAQLSRGLMQAARQATGGAPALIVPPTRMVRPGSK